MACYCGAGAKNPFPSLHSQLAHSMTDQYSSYSPSLSRLAGTATFPEDFGQNSQKAERYCKITTTCGWWENSRSTYSNRVRSRHLKAVPYCYLLAVLSYNNQQVWNYGEFHFQADRLMFSRCFEVSIDCRRFVKDCSGEFAFNSAVNSFTFCPAGSAHQL